MHIICICLLSLILNPCSSFWHSRSLVHSLKHHFLCHLWWSICGFSGPCKLRSHLIGLTMFLFHDSGRKHKRGPPSIFVGLYWLIYWYINPSTKPCHSMCRYFSSPRTFCYSILNSPGATDLGRSSALCHTTEDPQLKIAVPIAINFHQPSPQEGLTSD